ncbi:MAG TPA: RidA family protein [Anaerolineae bacterium]|nr:RidA family protein [Anaerolineae bacterium]
MSRRIIHTDNAPAAVGPYSQAVRVGNLVYTAGQIGIDPATGKLKEGLEAQTHQVMANVQAVLEAAGTSLDAVVKITIFLADMEDFAQVNAIYGAFFADAPPARSTVAVAGLPLGARVEIEVVAWVED